MAKKKKKRRVLSYLFSYDMNLIVAVLFLIVFGLVMIYSASYYTASMSDAFNHDPTFLLMSQLKYSILGIVVMLFVANVDYHFWKHFAMLGFLASIVLILLLKVPGLGVTVKGATRWIRIPGLGQFQVAEPVKAAEHAVREEAPPSPAAPVAEGEKAERIDAFLTGLLAQMGAEARPVIRMDENGTYQVELVGRELGGLIGRRGETLDAIQQLTNYAVNRGRTHRVRIHIDAEHYRAKREESLKRLANKVAVKVVKYRRNITLEPMNAYERHVIHAALQDEPGVTTYSIGSEPNRRVVVSYDREKRQ